MHLNQSITELQHQQSYQNLHENESEHSSKQSRMNSNILPKQLLQQSTSAFESKSMLPNPISNFNQNTNTNNKQVNFSPSYQQIDQYLKQLQSSQIYNKIKQKYENQHQLQNTKSQQNVQKKGNNINSQKYQNQLFNLYQKYQNQRIQSYQRMLQIIQGKQKINKLSKQHQQQQSSSQDQNQNKFPYSQNQTNNKIKQKQCQRKQKQKQEQNQYGRTCIVCGWNQGNIGVKKWQWCRICGNDCCEECIGRYRILRNNKYFKKQYQKQVSKQLKPVPVCQICDNQYLKAMIYFEDQSKLQIPNLCIFILKQNTTKNSNNSNNSINLNKSLIKQKQNHNLQSPNSSIPSNHPKSAIQLGSLHQRISHLKTLNTSLIYQKTQTNRKIAWGSQITKQLKSKYKKLRKQYSKLQYKKSFNSSALGDADDTLSCSRTQSQNAIKPPRAYQSDIGQNEFDIDNINESAIKSVLQDQTRLIRNGKKCCNGCFIM